MDTKSQISQARGNTVSRARQWVFTLNNYEDKDVSNISQRFEQSKALYIIGKEKGSSGTPHLQGYVRFSNQRVFTKVKAVIHEKAHIEVARGTLEDNLTYCSKEGDYITNCDIPKKKETLKEKLLKTYINTEWKNWQQEVLDICLAPREDRKIHWYNDTKGNQGKSFLCKYLYLKYNCVIASGRQQDVFNQIKIWMDENPNKSPKLVILDIPRHNIEYINYGCLEQIKNGLIYSGKYEGGICAFKPPHLIVFANTQPEFSKFSSDRWNYRELCPTNVDTKDVSPSVDDFECDTENLA